MEASDDGDQGQLNDQPEMDRSDSAPVKMVKIRADLEEYFEVVSHKDKTLKCKLAGRDGCKNDGITGVMTFNPQRGWFNLERHVTNVHKGDEQRQQLDTGDEGESRKIQIRADLEEFFEVVSQKEKTLKCKLAGRDGCKMDGISGVLKFCAQRGWFNLERHVIRTHKVLKAMPNAIRRNRKDPHNKKKKKEKLKHVREVRSSSSGNDETKWKNLLSKEKYCLVCQNVCPVLAENSADEEYYHYQLKRIFPGCEGSTKLSQQLFFMFFLRDVGGFPTERCEEFLKKCRGQRMPETWFSLCLACRELILQAASINEELVRLQNKLCELKALMKSKFKESASTSSSSCTVYWSTIEEEIRRHIFGNDEIMEGISNSNSPYNDDNPNEGSFGEYLIPDNSVDEEWTESDVKVEADCNEVLRATTTRTRSGRKCSRRNYKEMECLDDVDYDVVDEPESNANNLVSHSTPLIVKVEQESLSDNAESDMENNVANLANEDDDYEVAQSELSELESDESEFTPTRPSKAKSGSNKSKARTDSELILVSPKKTKTKSSSRQSGSSDMEAPCEDNEPVSQNGEFHVCQFCPSRYKSSRGLHDHLAAHEISKTQDNKHDCQQCGYPCHSEKSKKLHFKVKHGTEGGVRCSLCDYISPTQRQFHIHLQEHRDEAERERVDGKYLCKRCNRLFITFDILSKHTRTTHYKEIGVIPYKCDYCSLIMSSKRLLRDHVQQTHKKESRYFCELCGKGMMYMSKLRRHMNGHLKEKSFVCEICGADFNYSETMKQHIKKEHPDALESTTKNSSTSVQGHSAMNKYVCKHCGSDFASGTLLNRHIKSHAELFANKCDLCGKGYATAQSLRRHKEINHTRREVACAFCGKTFPHQEYIRNHYRFCRHHPEKRKPTALTGEPLQTIFVDAQDQICQNTSDIMETAMASSCMNQIQEQNQSSPNAQTSPLLVVPVNSEYKLEETKAIEPVTTNSWSKSTDSGQ